MKNHILAVLLLCSFTLSAQFDSNFEFLNHTEALISTSLPLEFNNQLYFVSHQTNTGGTTVYQLDNDYNLELIFETSLTSNAKLSYKTDSSFQIILDQLVSWDVEVSGFISITITKNEVPEIFEFHQNDTGQTSVCSLENYNSGTAAYIDQGTWAYTDFNSYAGSQYPDSLIIVDKDCGVKSVSHSNKGNRRLATDANQNLYLISKKNSTTDICLLNSNYDPEAVRTLSGNYRLIQTNQLKAYFFYDKFGSSSLLQYDPQTDQIENEWILPQNTSISHVYVSDEGQVLISAGTYILSGLSNGVLDTLTDYISSGFSENYRGVFQNQENELLYLGIFQNSISHAFVRNIDVIQNDDTKYSRVDLDISHFEVELVEQEISYVISDSINIYNMKYNASIGLRNNSSETINLTELWDPNIRYTSKFVIDEEIQPSEILAFETEINLHGQVFDDITIFNTGANYKFNVSENRISTNTMVATEEQPPYPFAVDVYPNPASDKLLLSAPKEIGSVSLFDFYGNKLKNYHELNSDNSLDVSDLPSGVYYLIVGDVNQNSHVTKVVKQ